MGIEYSKHEVVHLRDLLLEVSPANDVSSVPVDGDIQSQGEQESTAAQTAVLSLASLI